MKKAVLNLLLLAAAAAFVLVLLLLGALQRQNRQMQTCTGLQVEFADDYNFVTEEDVKGYMDSFYGPYVGQRIDSVNLTRIERILDVQSAVLKSEAYMTGDGMLNIRITQRMPVVRFQKGGSGFYVDERGCVFPLQGKFTSLVPVIDGNIPVFYQEGYKGMLEDGKLAAWMQDVLAMVSFMNGHRMWAEDIAQISVDGNGDLVLVPREGKEKFIFGTPDNYEKKFARIEKYYQYVRPQKEYTTVNVKYDGQIICKN